MKMNKVISRVLIFLYLCIPYLPLFGEIDRIASQWTFLSAVNFLSLVFISFNIKHFNFNQILFSKPIIFFSLFLLFSIVSMLKSINLTESSVEFFRYFTVFLLIILLPTLVSRFDNYKLLIFLLIFYSVIDILGILLQNSTNLPLIGFTGNKNIASASLIIKSNAILFICYKYKNTYSRFFGFVFMCMAYSVVFLIGSKAGFLSSIIIITILGVIGLIKKFDFRLNLILIFSILIAMLLSNSLNRNIERNISDTINITNDQGSTDRLKYYSQAFQAFIENPISGIGIGNWKIYSIKYDSKTMNNYIVQYHTHNDYIQLFAETGFFGGIFYVLFIVSFLLIIRELYNKWIILNEDLRILLLVSFLGYIIYLIDSNLNFPAARVIMQINLSSILALLISSKLAINNNEDD